MCNVTPSVFIWTNVNQHFYLKLQCHKNVLSFDSMKQHCNFFDPIQNIIYSFWYKYGTIKPNGSGYEVYFKISYNAEVIIFSTKGNYFKKIFFLDSQLKGQSHFPVHASKGVILEPENAEVSQVRFEEKEKRNKCHQKNLQPFLQRVDKKRKKERKIQYVCVLRCM